MKQHHRDSNEVQLRKEVINLIRNTEIIIKISLQCSRYYVNEIVNIDSVLGDKLHSLAWKSHALNNPPCHIYGSISKVLVLDLRCSLVQRNTKILGCIYRCWLPTSSEFDTFLLQHQVTWISFQIRFLIAWAAKASDRRNIFKLTSNYTIWNEKSKLNRNHKIIWSNHFCQASSYVCLTQNTGIELISQKNYWQIMGVF